MFVCDYEKYGSKADSDKNGISTSSLSINQIPKQYYEQPVSVKDHLDTTDPDDTFKVFPYVNNRELSRYSKLIGKCENLGHATTYYNPAREKLYTRYSPNDWNFSVQSNMDIATDERASADKARANADWLIKQTDNRTKNRQNQVTRKLGERAEDIAFWKKELENEAKCMKEEIKALKDKKEVTQSVIMEARRPLEIATECLRQREKRMGIELVKDAVEKGINKEVALIRAAQEKVKKVLDKVNAQDKLNLAALHALEVDAQQKGHAFTVDQKAHQINNNSANLGYHPGIEFFDNTITVPKSWIKYTQANICRSQNERNRSEHLRNDLDESLRNAMNEMWKNFNNVNTALQARLRETVDARNKLQSHLQRILKTISEISKNTDILQKAICDKEAYMKVAQTRLDERTRRINVELCHDPAMKALLQEVEELRETIRILKSRLKPTELSLARLLKTKALLEHDIAVKEGAMDLDKACLEMRRVFPIDESVYTTYNVPLPK